MKKLYILLIMLLCFWLGFFVWKKEVPNYENKSIRSPDISTGLLTQSGIWIEKMKLSPQMIVWPIQSADCEKFSDIEKDNCLLTVAVRSAKNLTDTGSCSTLKNPERCEKAISDQFSRKFDIPIMGKYPIQKIENR